MSKSTPGLVHTLGTVPGLLSSCLSLSKSKSVGIRELRLVSRDIGEAALQAVESCSLQVGEGADPDPHQFARIMRFAQLNKVNLTVLVTSGSTGPSSQQQLVTCLSHVQHITATMQTALRWVNHVHVSVRHTLHHTTTETDAKSCKEGVSGCANRATPGVIPDSLQAVICSTLECFAASVPHLQKLSVRGEIGLGSAILAFGSHCPQLSTLQMDMLHKSSTALLHISSRLPSFTHLILTAEIGPNGPSIEFLKQAPLAHLRECTLLSILEIDVGLLFCKPGCWDFAPLSLEEISYNRSMVEECMPPELCARLKRLTTTFDFRNTDLQAFLAKFPLLQELTVHEHHHSVELLSHSDDDLRPLKERFAAGFKFTCSYVMFSGSSEAVRDVLLWLPPLPSVTTCNIYLTGTTHVNCLQDIARVMPNAKTLYISNEETGWDESPVYTAAEFFEPLLGCVFLKSVNVRMYVEFTTLWLFNLCRGLRALSSLQYVGCLGVDGHVLRGALPLVEVGRVVRFKVYTQDDFHVSDDEDAEQDEA